MPKGHGVLLVAGAWLLLTPPWQGDDTTGCPFVTRGRPYAEWTRDGVAYPSEASCREAKARQSEAFDFPWRNFGCIGRLSDARSCVSTDALGSVLPREEAPPEKVEIWLKP